MDEKATHSDLATATDAADRWRELVNSSNDEKLIRDNYKALLQQQLAVLQERVNALNDTLSAIQYVNPILVEPLDRGPGLLSALRRQGEEIKALRKFEPALLDGPVAIQHNGNHARSWTRIVLACAETAWAPLILTGSVKLPEGLELDIIRRCLNGYDSSRVRVNLNIEFDGLSNKIRSGDLGVPNIETVHSTPMFGLVIDEKHKSVHRKGSQFRKIDPQIVNNEDAWTLMADLNKRNGLLTTTDVKNLFGDKPADRNIRSNARRRLLPALDPFNLTIEKWCLVETISDES